MYLLDTNAVIDFCNSKLPINAKNLLTNIEPSISIITRMELFSSNKIADEEKRALEDFVKISTIYSHLTEDIAIKAIGIRQQYNIKLPDAIIAATALTYQLKLISRNTKDFKDIEGLQLIDPYEL